MYELKLKKSTSFRKSVRGGAMGRVTEGEKKWKVILYLNFKTIFMLFCPFMINISKGRDIAIQDCL